MKPKREDEDSRLFREAVSDVKPLTLDPRAPPVQKPPSRVRFTRRERQILLDESPLRCPDDPPIEREDELSFRRAGVQLSVLRKLRGGEYGVQGEIDLHGLTGTQAEHALVEFLAHRIGRRARCVRVIHGKGLRSNDRLPVLKNTVNRILRQLPEVMAFVSARQTEGGSGATYVLLRH